MDGQIEACHGRGHIFLHFRCEIARALSQVVVGRGRTELGGRGRSDITVLDGAALPIPIVVFSRHLFATTARRARARARPSAIFRLPQGICSPIGGRVESQDGTGKQMGRASEGRPSDDPPAKGYSEIEEATGRASERGKLAGLTAASLIFSTKVLSPLCQEWSAFKPCMKAGGRETLPTHRQVRQLDSAPRSVLYGQG